VRCSLYTEADADACNESHIRACACSPGQVQLEPIQGSSATASAAARGPGPRRLVGVSKYTGLPQALATILREEGVPVGGSGEGERPGWFMVGGKMGLERGVCEEG